MMWQLWLACSLLIRRYAKYESHGSAVGMVAEFTVTGNELKVDRVPIAADTGHVVNPRTVASAGWRSARPSVLPIILRRKAAPHIPNRRGDRRRP
jgi:hypothetical protein